MWLPYKVCVGLKENQATETLVGDVDMCCPVSFQERTCCPVRREWSAGELELSALSELPSARELTCPTSHPSQGILYPAVSGIKTHPFLPREGHKGGLPIPSVKFCLSFPFTSFDLPANPVCDNTEFMVL